MCLVNVQQNYVSLPLTEDVTSITNENETVILAHLCEVL